MGHAQPASQREVDVMIDGDRLLAHGPSYMKNYAEGPVSGSSVATALTAGLASLSLLLARMANSPEVATEFKTRQKMLRLFEEMQAKNGSRRKKLLVPANLFKRGFDIDKPNPCMPEALLRFRLG